MRLTKNTIVFATLLTACTHASVNVPPQGPGPTPEHVEPLPLKTVVEGHSWTVRLPEDGRVLNSWDDGFDARIKDTYLMANVSIVDGTSDPADMVYDMFRDDPTLVPVSGERRLKVNDLDGYVVAGRKNVDELTFNFVANRDDKTVSLRCTGEGNLLTVGSRCYDLLKGLTIK